MLSYFGLKIIFIKYKHWSLGIGKVGFLYEREKNEKIQL